MDTMTNGQYKKHYDRRQQQKAAMKADAARRKADHEAFLNYMEGIKAQAAARRQAFVDRNSLSV